MKNLPKSFCNMLQTLCPWADLLGRIALALIFLISVPGKLGDGFAGVQGYMAAKGVPGLLLPLVILLELGGGVALILGFFTRFIAFSLAVFCVLAALLFHAEIGDFAQKISFFKNFAIAGGLLILARTGAGPFSVDHYLRNRK